MTTARAILFVAAVVVVWLVILAPIISRGMPS